MNKFRREFDSIVEEKVEKFSNSVDISSGWRLPITAAASAGPA